MTPPRTSQRLTSALAIAGAMVLCTAWAVVAQPPPPPPPPPPPRPPPATQPAPPSFGQLLRDAQAAYDATAADRDRALAQAAAALAERDAARGELAQLRRGYASAAVTGPVGLSPDVAAARGIGVNVNKVTDWDGEGRFVDASRNWRPPYAGGRPAKLDPQTGAPLEDCTSYWFARGYPDGVYRFEWTGGGGAKLDVQVAGCPVRGRGPGFVEFELAKGHGAAPVQITFRGVDPADPMREWHCWTPGEPDRAQVYRAAYRAAEKPFRCYRFLNLTGANSSPEVEWADRTQPDWPWQAQYGTGTGTERGSAWEFGIRLCNDNGRPGWVNVPHQASDDYVRRLARLWLNGLDPRLELVVELSNEWWNRGGSFQQGDYFQRQAEAAGIWAPHAYARRLYQVQQIFRAEWGPAHAARLRFVCGGQAANPWMADEALKELGRLAKADGGRQTRDVIAAVCPAFYFNITPFDATVPPEVYVARLGAKPTSIDPAGPTRKKLDEHKAMAAREGVALWFYEGGFAPGGKAEGLLLTSHPGMGQASANWAAGVRAELGPGGLACHFSGPGDDQWGTAPAVDQCGPRHQALVAAAAAAAAWGN